MAEKEGQDGHGSSKFVAAAPKLENLFKQDQALPLWFSRKDSSNLEKESEGGNGEAGGAEGKFRKGEGKIAGDPGDECGLELSLGLSLGGPVSKQKSKTVRQDGPAALDPVGVERAKEEDRARSPSSKDSPKRSSEGGLPRSRSFWQDLKPPREGAHEEVGPQDSGAAGETLAQGHSADANSATGLSSIGPCTAGRFSTHAGLMENLTTTEYGRGDESKVAVAHDFWQGSLANTIMKDDINTSEEKPFIKDLLRAPMDAAAASAASYWSRKVQGGVAMQLLNGFRDVGDVDPVMRLSPALQRSLGVPYPSKPIAGQEIGDTKNEGLQSVNVGPRQQSKVEVTSLDESARSVPEEYVLDTIDEMTKQSRQVARQKRKALLEEQKLQKKAKKDGASGQSLRQMKQGSGIPVVGSKVTSVPGTSVEISTGTHEITSSPDSQVEMAVSGFRRTSSAIWPHGSVSEGPVASSPDVPAAENAKQNEIRTPIGIHRSASGNMIGLRGGLQANFRPGGDFAGRGSAGAVSASSANGLEFKQGVKDIENRRDTHAQTLKETLSTNSRLNLPRALSLSRGQIPAGAFTQLQSSSSLPYNTQFGPLQPWPDPGDPVPNREANVDASVDASAFTSGSKAVSQQGSCFTPMSRNQDSANIQRSRFQQGTTLPISTSGLVIQVGEEASSLKLGIAAGQVFGGTGSSPDLPWVTCTGGGPNGKSICGVLYSYQKAQVKIVCACHGRHMSPSEFVEHAGIVDLTNPEKNIVVGTRNMTE